MTVERKRSCGRVGLNGPRQRLENVYVDEEACVGCDKNTCLRIRVNVLHMRVHLFREALRRHLKNSSRNQSQGNAKLYPS